MDLESAWCRLKAEEAVEHHLRHEDAFEEFLVQAQPARDVPALHGATLGVLGVAGAVTAPGLDLVEPDEDLLQTLPGILRPIDLQAAH